MDPFRLLSRSTRRSREKKVEDSGTLPSSGRTSQPQLFPEDPRSLKSEPLPTRKRKRGANGPYDKSTDTGLIEFSNDDGSLGATTSPAREGWPPSAEPPDRSEHSGRLEGLENKILRLEKRKDLLRAHKLKATWINPPSPPKKEKRKSKEGNNMKARVPIFPSPILSFKDLSSASISHQLANNIAEQGFDVPTEVQLGALPLLMNDSAVYLNETRPVDNGIGQHTDGIDLLTVAPTGSGKTLAFLIPLMHSLRLDKRSETTNERHTSAIILAPTRELASQIVNEGRKLAKNSGMRITQMRKGMRFGVAEQSPKPEGGFGSGTRHNDSIVKADILVATPGVLQTMLHESKDLQPLRHVRYLILDEADVLLDPLFREQTLEIWNSLTHHDLRVSMWSATMGSNIEELAVATIRGRRERLREETGSDVDEAPLIRLIVGLKDSAVPNVQHKLIYAATEQGKLMGLRQLLHPTTSSIDAGPPLRPPFLVFTQTIERAIALHAELLYDIPAEAGGIDRIAVLHSDLSDTARDRVMTRFRNGEVWVLITTDLLSRGVDFLGVNGVVNYDIPTSSAAYVHRIGRTGRAGRSGGVAVTLYSKEDLPYLKHIANVVAMARRQKGDKLNMDRWLLDSLPSLSRNEKQKLRKRGVESRTTRGKEKDPEAARKTQISSKSGYDRRMENRRKAAIVGSKRDAQIESDAGAETDFGGFE